jgi:hypothetical protein
MTLEERAESARATLFDRYDALNALWLQAEEQLTRFHIPRPAYHSYDEYQDFGNPPGAMTSKCLSLQKVKGKWRICYGLYDEWCDRDYGWTPITECSAQVRVEAARHVDKLREKVVKTAEDFIPRVDEAIQTLAATVGQLVSIESQDLLTERAKLNGHHNK